MSELEALLLGIVQGLTEFLPISSSGHLILVPWLQDYTFLQDNPEFNKTFDVALHIGTLVAVLGYFREDLVKITRAFFTDPAQTRDRARRRAPRLGDHRRHDPRRDRRWARRPASSTSSLGEPWMIALELIVCGLVLGPRRPPARGQGHRPASACATASTSASPRSSPSRPGASRSGVTITMGRYLHLTRDTAARISFLIGVPAIAGAGAVKACEAIKDGLPDGVAGPIIVGMLAAAVSGYLAIAGLLAYVRSNSYDAFVIYRVMVGLGILILIATGLRSASF